MARRRDDDDDYDDDDEYDKPRSVRKRRKKGRSGSSAVDFILCRAMIGRILAPTLFWLGAIASVFHGIHIIVLVFRLAPGWWEKTLGSLYGLLFVIGGPLVLRILSECIILFFNVNDTLTGIRNDLQSED